ncbi:MAG: BadF/BadG/BcrA/BcrD type ATPase [Anaerolineae bacterium]|nr:BadF/BadG/BcrA/BcrD type ATPase [Anaerolineae bacterium]
MVESEHPMPLVLGIDGGGSKTLALVAGVGGNVVGRGLAGPSNFQVVGIEAAYAALDAAVAAALLIASQGELVAICLGMAGAGRPQDRAIIQAWCDDRYPGVPVSIVHDAALLLSAGTPDGWGLALICGTGSLCYGEHPSGVSARAGGWGYLLGDEGSGYAIGLAALRAVARSADGRGSVTALTQRILAHWSLSAPQDLIPYIYQHIAQEDSKRSGIAQLTPLVLAAVGQGDAVATSIIAQAGYELALAVHAVIGQLGLESPVPCALGGGVLVQGLALREAFLKAVTKLHLNLDPVTVVEEPALGAVRLAQDLRLQKS